MSIQRTFCGSQFGRLILTGGIALMVVALSPVATSADTGDALGSVPSAGDITNAVQETATNALEDAQAQASQEGSSEADEEAAQADAPQIVCDTFDTIAQQGISSSRDCGAGDNGDDGNGDGDNGGDGSGGDGDNGDNGDDSGGDGDDNGDGNGGSDDGAGDGDDNGGSDGDAGDDGNGNGGGSGSSGAGGGFVVHDIDDGEETGTTTELTIVGETVTRLGERIFRVTWETNRDAVSRVAYGTTSQAGLATSSSPTFGYAHNTVETTQSEMRHSVVLLLDEVPAGDLFIRPVSRAGDVLAFGTELRVGPGTATQTAPEQCGEHISTFIRPGARNNAGDVRRLQEFLQAVEGFNIAVTGVYGTATQQAVEDFQMRYSSEVLAPWGITAPTRNVYLTTRKKINELHCESETFPLTAEEQAEIERFRTSTDTDDAVTGNTVGTAGTGTQESSALAEGSTDAEAAEDNGEEDAGEEESQVAAGSAAVDRGITFRLFERISESVRTMFSGMRGLLPGGTASPEEEE